MYVYVHIAYMCIILQVALTDASQDESLFTRGFFRLANTTTIKVKLYILYTNICVNFGHTPRSTFIILLLCWCSWQSQTERRCSIYLIQYTIYRMYCEFQKRFYAPNKRAFTSITFGPGPYVIFVWMCLWVFLNIKFCELWLNNCNLVDLCWTCRCEIATF